MIPQTSRPVPAPATRAKMILLATVTLFALGGFVAVAVTVMTGPLQSLDQQLIQSLRNPEDPTDPIGPKWLEEIGRDLTALGGVAGLVLLAAAIVGYLLLCGKWRAVAWIAITTVGGLLVTGVLKDSFNRPRPDLVPHLSHVATSSFPSGHSMLSTIVYLTLGVHLARHVQRYVLKAYFLMIAILLTVLVGVSRVYMGVHYPTDVLAGWAAGIAWVSACRLAAQCMRATEFGIPNFMRPD